MNRQEILVIIVAYHGMSWLRKTLPALVHEGVAVFLRDNESDESLQKLFQSLNPGGWEYAGGANIGFGRANNEGLRWGLENGFHRYFLLNQDAGIKAEDLVTWAHGISPSASTAIHCPVQLNWDNDSANPNFQNRYARDWEDRTEPFEVPFVNAAAWYLTASTLKKVGGFNPAFFMYGEDREYVWRLQQAGGQVWVHPNAKVRHASSAAGKSKDLRWVAQNKIRAEELHHYFNLRNDGKNLVHHGWLKRAIKRMLSRDFGRLTFSGALWREEIRFYHYARHHAKHLKAMRALSDQDEVRHLGPIQFNSESSGSANFSV